MGEELAKGIELRLYKMNLFGYTVEISDTVIIMWIVMAFLILSAFLLTRKMQTIPKGKQNFVETVVEMINSLAKSSLGHHWKPFAPYLGTILLFLLFANTIGIFNLIPSAEQLYHFTGMEFFEHLPEFTIRPPTKDINMTICLAIASIIVVLIAGLTVKKPLGWLKSFIEPTPVVLPFKILDYVVRPLSLCFRLFGNILGAFIVMELIYMAFPLAFPAAISVYFDLFDGGLQAYIFVFLTSLYIAEAIE